MYPLFSCEMKERYLSDIESVNSQFSKWIPDS